MFSTIPRQFIDSSMLKSIGYDAERQVLVLEFAGYETIYEYYNVPSDIHEALLESDSVGRTFNQLVRNHFNYQKMESEEIFYF